MGCFRVMGQTINFILFERNFIKVRLVAHLFLHSLQGNSRIIPQSDHEHFLPNLQPTVIQIFHVVQLPTSREIKSVEANIFLVSLFFRMASSKDNYVLQPFLINFSSEYA
jgi:hypothetical protein